MSNIDVRFPLKNTVKCNIIRNKRSWKKINILEKIIDAIFPPVCAICGELNKEYLCEKCKNTLAQISKVAVDRYSNKNFINHIYMFKYKELVREKLIEYKFNNKPYYYKTFAKILINNKKMYDILKTYDIIIPVPLNNIRKRQRGYNQTELIAKELAKNFENLEYMDVLIKTKNTVPQSTLNKQQRQKNLENVYKLRESTCINNKNILLFDDIYTTGTTVNECAKILKTLGKNKISVLSIAKD